MGNYKTVTYLWDMGPCIMKTILELPCEVGANDIDAETFNVYVERRRKDTKEIVMQTDFATWTKKPSKGYRTVKKAYPCTEDGKFCARSKYAALEFGEDALGHPIDGDVLSSRYINSVYRITQLKELPEETTGLVFDQCTGDIMPQLTGWTDGKAEFEGITLGYGYFVPDMEAYLHPAPKMFGPAEPPKEKKVPLVVWLHGAGEGGTDPKIAYTGNKVAALSWPDIQKKLGGAAYVLIPQCSTVWMDDGVEKLGRSNQSIYVKALKAMIDWFIEKYSDDIDTDRIYIGGLSNGGFMTMRMLIDYPGFFAAGIPACQVFYGDNLTDDMVQSLKNQPIWMIHSDDDPIVPPFDTTLPVYEKIKNAGNDNIHLTYFDHMEDLSGMYKDAQGRPVRYFGHAVWVHAYNDDCKTEVDGSNVMWKGRPVTLWTWVGQQKL